MVVQLSHTQRSRPSTKRVARSDPQLGQNFMAGGGTIAPPARRRAGGILTPTLLWLRIMPKRYEEEINEILHKFGDWPSPNERRQRPRSEAPRRSQPPLGLGDFFQGLGAQQLMGIGLLLILAGLLLRFSVRMGVVMGIMLGTYATAIGFLVLFTGYIMAVVRG